MGNNACCERPIQPTQTFSDKDKKVIKMEKKSNIKSGAEPPEQTKKPSKAGNDFNYFYTENEQSKQVPDPIKQSKPKFGNSTQGHDADIDDTHRQRGTKIEIDTFNNPPHDSDDHSFGNSSPHSSHDFRHEVKLVAQIAALPDISPSMLQERVLNTYNKLGPMVLPEKYQQTKVEGLQIQPTQKLFNDALYQGQWKDNARHGYGKCLFADGSYYEGQLVNNQADGYGRLIHTDGDAYQGEWKQDKAHGKGLFQRDNGAKYDGDWENDQQTGQGEEFWTDGSSYKGHYQKGLKHGQGLMKWKDQSYYEGMFSNNLICGIGTYHWSDGRVFKGEWKNNKIEGQGEFTWQDGRKYIGHYVNDKKEGYGEFYWPDGRVFKGDWLDGKQNGHGIMTDNTGKKQEGVWANGKYQSSNLSSVVQASHKTSVQSIK